MQRARLRARHGLYVREGAGPGQKLRLPLRAHDSPAADRARADEETPRFRPDRLAHQLRFEERPPLQGVPRQAARRQDRLRVPGTGTEREGGQAYGARGKSYTSRFRTPSAFDSMNARL